MLAAAQGTAALAQQQLGDGDERVPAGWGCEWLLEAAAANAEEVGTYLAQCGVW